MVNMSHKSTEKRNEIMQECRKLITSEIKEKVDVEYSIEKIIFSINKGRIPRKLKKKIKNYLLKNPTKFINYFKTECIANSVL